MNIDFTELGFTAYQNLIIPLNIARHDFLEIRAIFKADTSRRQHLEKVYWVISSGRFLFSKNKTWVQEMSHKTDKFRDKTAFDSFDEAVEFTKQNWDKVIKPFK
jgi:hypothetical protein